MIMKDCYGLQVLVLFLAAINISYTQNCSENSVGNLDPTVRINSFSDTTKHGVFLNRNNSAACRGQVIGWRFCYYIKQGTKIFNISLSVGVWEPKLNGTQYKLVNNSHHYLSISPPGNDQVRFVCQEENLDCDKRFPIEQGAIVGLRFPEKATAHLIVSDDSSSVSFWNGSETADINVIEEESLEEMGGFALFLEVVMGNNDTTNCTSSTPTTPIPTSTTPATPIPTSTTPATPIPTSTTPATPIPTSTTPATPIPTLTMPATPIPTPPTPAMLPDWALIVIGVFGVIIVVLALLLLILCMVIVKCGRSHKKARFKPRILKSEMWKEETKPQGITLLNRNHINTPTPSIQLTSSSSGNSQPETCIVGLGDHEVTPHTFYDGELVANTHCQQLFGNESTQTSQTSYGSDLIVTNRQLKERQVKTVRVPKQKEINGMTITVERQPTKKVVGTELLRPESSETLLRRCRSVDCDLHMHMPAHQQQRKVNQTHLTSTCTESRSNGRSKEDDFVSSIDSDYPYVLHSSEVLGHPNLRPSNSLPNICHSEISSPPLTDADENHPVSGRTLDNEPIYSYPYSFMVDPRGRTSSRDMAWHYGLQLNTQSKKQTATVEREQSIFNANTAPLNVPRLISPEYVEIPDLWLRKKPIPLPRKLKCKNQSSESSQSSSQMLLPPDSADKSRVLQNGNSVYGGHISVYSPDYHPLIASTQENRDDIYMQLAH